MRTVEFLVVDWYETNHLLFKYMLNDLGVDGARIHYAKTVDEASRKYEELTSERRFVPLVLIVETENRNGTYQFPKDLVKRAKQERYQTFLHSTHPQQKLREEIARLLGDDVVFSERTADSSSSPMGIRYHLLQAGLRAMVNSEMLRANAKV